MILLNERNMVQFTPDETELPPVDSYLSVRTFVLAITLTAITLAMFLSHTYERLVIATVASVAIAFPFGAAYGFTSNLSRKKRLLLTAAFSLSLIVFASSVSFGKIVQMDIRNFYETDEWSPMPPEILATPLMLTSFGIAIVSGYMTLKLATVRMDNSFND